MNITANGVVTLSGAGIYIFRPGGALTTGANSLVTLANGACESDVFWGPVGATTLGANAALSVTPTFVGTILDAAGISIGHFANMTGRALAFGGTVLTDAATITVPTCAPFAGPPGSITINKVTQGGDSTFLFSSTVPGNLTFPIATVSGSGSNVISGIAAGSYLVTESVPAGWNLSSLTCTDPTSDSTVNAGEATATINLAAGESVSCTFTDTLALLPPPIGVPTLAEWALITLAMLLLLAGWLQYRRRQ
jgi:Ice-binding-like/IPTL-CTERM motif